MQTILLVDGHQTTRGVLAQVLRDEGFATLEAHDGEEALRMGRAHEPAVILLDVSLQDDSSPMLMENLRTIVSAHETPIIIVSNSVTNPLRTTEADGVSAVLQAPFHLTDLLREVRRTTDAQ